MNAKEIYEALLILAQSNGKYGRLLESWIEWDMLEVALAELELYKPNDVIDLVMLIEGGV